MLNYDDPEKQYVFRKINQTSIKTKIWMLVFFILAGLPIVYLVKNDFNPNIFLSKNSFEPKCSVSYDLKLRQDIKTSRIEAEKALADNFAEMETWDGFKRAEVLEKTEGFKGSLVPVIQIVFDRKSVKRAKKSKVKIPKEICSFSTEVLIE